MTIRGQLYFTIYIVFFEEYELGPWAVVAAHFRVPVSRKPTEIRASGRSLM